MSDEALSSLRRWRDSPLAFVQEVLKVVPDPWQEEALKAIATQQRVALIACKGPGKSCFEAWVIWWFMATRPYPKIACTSITGDNLRDGLWTELAKWQQRSPLLSGLFEWRQERIVNRESPETWWASARQWSRSADSQQQADTLAGLHADYVLFVLDEAGGIPDSVAAAAEAALSTGVETKLLIAGNPTVLEGPLYRAATKDRPMWWVKEISGDPDDPLRAPRISKVWAQQQIDTFGRDSNWVRVNVFGKFPLAAHNALLGVDEVVTSMRRDPDAALYQKMPRILGVDVARQGNDRSVLAPRQGVVAFRPRVYRDLDLMQLSNEVARFIDEWRPDGVFIDETGLGVGVLDRLRQLGFPVVGVNFGGRPRDQHYANRRSEMWWLFAEWVKAGGSLPEDNELVRELTAPTYSYTAQDKLTLESKGDLKLRLGSSPDIADAFALTFAEPVAIAEVDDDREAQTRRNPRSTWDYNPIAVARA